MIRYIILKDSFAKSCMCSVLWLFVFYAIEFLIKSKKWIFKWIKSIKR